jgi:hypothetical protein
MDFDDATIEVDELIDETFELAILSILLELEDDSMRPERQMRFPNAQQGQQYVEELLNSNHPDRVRAGGILIEFINKEGWAERVGNKGSKMMTSKTRNRLLLLDITCI